MRADRAQQSAQVPQFGAIQLQHHNSGSARRCTADNNRQVFIPIKMLPPALTAWMKKRHHTPRLWIADVCGRELLDGCHQVFHGQLDRNLYCLL